METYQVLFAQPRFIGAVEAKLSVCGNVWPFWDAAVSPANPPFHVPL